MKLLRRILALWRPTLPPPKRDDRSSIQVFNDMHRRV